MKIIRLIPVKNKKPLRKEANTASHLSGFPAGFGTFFLGAGVFLAGAPPKLGCRGFIGPVPPPLLMRIDI
jgi:hypothetical protein